ncbi:Hypothetical predicted protein [Paramuricea clavata]|nr:Hypothetical predicted protein [Paramuricea clavata]
MSMRFLKNCLLIILFLVVIHFWLKTKSYRFSKEDVVKIGEKYAGREIQQAFQKIASELQEHYPGHILPTKHREWVMYKYSGMTLSMTILHASLTEYVLLFGSALDTDGYLGRHWLNCTMLLLSGSVKYWKEGDIEAIEYKIGDSFTFHSGSTGCLGWKANTWVLEYGRGFLPMSMPAIISDGLFTSFDVIGIFKMFRAFGVAYYYELKSEIGSFISSI